MSLEYQKRQYEERMNLIEAKYKKIAEIFHAKGRKAFNDAIYKQKLPNWNEFFEDEWVKFTTLKLRCPECHHARDFKLDLERGSDVMENLNQYINLICTTCGKLIDINKCIIIKGY